MQRIRDCVYAEQQIEIAVILLLIRLIFLLPQCKIKAGD
jgi:hypothetical protein